MEETLSSAREKGYVETLLGRKRYADGLTSSNMNIVKAEKEHVSICQFKVLQLN